ncbi:hypothetical protein Tco_0878777 [Tanacetum coccineum]|uniref:Xylulose kinase-1 n=1 Tax=Tanacetum coccineum TaxID=301880 RepID=A0ABQ5C295_9ASTR
MENNRKGLTGRDLKRNIMILPPVSVEEQIAVQRETKARTILLQSLPEDHMADFHHLDDARDIWLAVKARLGEGLHKGYDSTSTFLGPTVAITLKTKGGLDYLSFNDLYNKLRTLKIDVKGGSSYDSRVSFNNFTLLHKSNLSPLAIEKLDLEELDIKCKWAMHSVRINRFEKKLGRKMKFNNKDASSLTKRKVKCLKCSVSWVHILGNVQKNMDSKARCGKMVAAPSIWDDCWTEVDATGGLLMMLSTAANCLFVPHGTLQKSGPTDIAPCPPRSKLVRFGDTFGSDKVFDLSAPSIFDSSPKDGAENPLYNRFVKAVGMNDVPPPITGTFMPPSNNPDLDDTQFTYGSKSNNHENNSCQGLSAKTIDLLTSAPSSVTQVMSKTLPTIKSTNMISNFSFKHGFVCGSKFHLIKDCDFYEKQLELNNKPMWTNVAKIPSFVPKAAYVPTDGRNITTSVPTGSRNRITSVPAGSRNRPTYVPAGRTFSAGWKNHVARPMTKPSSHYFQHFRRSDYYNHMYMDEGRWGTAVSPPHFSGKFPRPNMHGDSITMVDLIIYMV